MTGHKQRSGWLSTKLHLALIGIAVLTLAFVFVVWRTGSPAGFGEYTIGLVSLVGTYSASRVGETFAMRRRVPIPAPPDEPPAGG